MKIYRSKQVIFILNLVKQGYFMPLSIEHLYEYIRDPSIYSQQCSKLRPPLSKGGQKNKQLGGRESFFLFPNFIFYKLECTGGGGGKKKKKKKLFI